MSSTLSQPTRKATEGGPWSSDLHLSLSVTSRALFDSFRTSRPPDYIIDLKATRVKEQMSTDFAKKDAGQQEMIEKAALSPLLAPLTPEEFSKADKRVSYCCERYTISPTPFQLCADSRAPPS